ncbi:hypothetical protein DE146DRAFT_225170 [Phaeosphaeria sp. MPI-PUGE-AT-0046c]|nr:hypothetical protein DE146DRAFT_225170 [Phaeosphaeria sp. MPI-PUGE-AT-0046c]
MLFHQYSASFFAYLFLLSDPKPTDPPESHLPHSHNSSQRTVTWFFHMNSKRILLHQGLAQTPARRKADSTPSSFETISLCSLCASSPSART